MDSGFLMWRIRPEVMIQVRAEAFQVTSAEPACQCALQSPVWGRFLRAYVRVIRMVALTVDVHMPAFARDAAAHAIDCRQPSHVKC